MKIIVSKHIPARGYIAMAVYGVIFWRKEYEYKMQDEEYLRKIINHESIHKAQMEDFCKWLPIGGTIFYILYGVEWLLKAIPCLILKKDAYSNLAAEVEAYNNAKDFEYLNGKRKKFQWLKNCFTLASKR